MLDFGKRRNIWVILSLMLLCRLAITPLYVNAGRDYSDGKQRGYDYCPITDTLPIDFYGYVCPAQRVLDGKLLYTNYSIHKDYYRGFPYPPAFPYLLAGLISVFGLNFVILKLPAVFFDAGICLMTFLLAEHMLGTRKANILSAIYGFSYISILSSGAVGKDHHIFIFFMLLAYYFVLKGRVVLGASCLGVSMFFKLPALLYVPAILYFLYRRYGPKEPIVFGAVFWLVVLALLAPFFAIEGANLLYPYNVGSSMSIDGFTVLNLIRLTYGLPYHAMHPGMLLKDSNPQDPMNYDGSNPFNIFLKFLEKPFTLVGLVLPLYLIISHRTRDDEFELVRNTVVFIAAFMVFSKSFYDIYFLWFFPFLLILFGKDLKEPKNTNLIGMALVWAAVALWAWAWSAQYWRSSFEYVMLWASMGIAVVGTYLAYGLFERKKRILLTCLLSIHIYGQSMNSFPFHLFYPLISRFVGAEFFRRLVYYVGYYILIISTLAIIYLLVKEAFKEPQENAVSS